MAGEKFMGYKENIRPPLRVLAFIYFLLASLVIAIWASLPQAIALISFISSILLIALIAFSLRSKISVEEDWLYVGRAKIEKKYIQEIVILDKEQMRLERTRDIDPAAFLALNFWEPRGVKIFLNDSRDKTPYWLVSTKRGKELAQALKS
jgi:hypothetical protein